MVVPVLGLHPQHRPFRKGSVIMRMRALVALPDRDVEQGQEFDVARPIEALALSYQRKAKILEGLRLHLEPVTVPSETNSIIFQPYISRDLTGENESPEALSESSPPEEQPRRKRRYRRRDLTAEP